MPGGSVNFDERVELFCWSLEGVGLRSSGSKEIFFVVVDSQVDMEQRSDTAAIDALAEKLSVG